MKHMKLEGKKDDAPIIEGKEEKNEYPCGLKLYLDKEIMDMLDLEAIPGVGDEAYLKAKVMIESVYMRKSKEEKDKGMCLQITHMDLKQKAEEKSASDMFYAKD